MNQAELIKKVAEVSGLTQKDIEHALKTAGDVISDALAEEGDVVLPGLGKLVTQAKAARIGRNPKTKEPVEITARKAIKFRAGKALKDAVLHS
ncbi:MAG: HU family DNA-binding protein [Azonexus sp.]